MSDEAQARASALDKVRKLLNLAQNNGATYGEAENAMAMASAIMAKQHSCASRLWQRAYRIVEDMKKDDTTAQAATGCTALTVAHSFDQQLDDIKQWMEKQKFEFKNVKEKPKRPGLGSMAGLKAGDAIKIRKEVT